MNKNYRQTPGRTANLAVDGIKKTNSIPDLDHEVLQFHVYIYIYIYIYKYSIYIYLLYIYIHTYAQRLGFAQALQRRGSHFQTNVDATSQNSYGKNNKSTREY